MVGNHTSIRSRSPAANALQHVPLTSTATTFGRFSLFICLDYITGTHFSIWRLSFVLFHWSQFNFSSFGRRRRCNIFLSYPLLSGYSPATPIRIFFILRVSLEFRTCSLFFYAFLINWCLEILILIKDIPSLPLQKNILIGVAGLYTEKI